MANKPSGILLALMIILFFMLSCKKKTYYDIDFIVENNCGEQINVEYSIRICSSIGNSCSPQDFNDYISPNQSVELYVKDNMTEDADIQNAFLELNIIKGSETSDYIFWDSDKLSKTKYDDRIEYILTVDSAFFKP